MQKYTLSRNEKAVLQAKFQTEDGEIKFIHENENASWVSDNPDVVKITDTTFDGTNYNVTIHCLSTGIANLTAIGDFLGNDRASGENDFYGYKLSGCCQIEVRPALASQVYFTLSHKGIK